jgi:hypothetical protein
MKKQILTVIAALALVWFWLAPTTLKNTSLAWINWDSLTGRHGFYFKKRQWLADLRTIAAAIRYLYRSYPASSTSLVKAVSVPELPPIQAEISTNLLGLDGAESLAPLEGKRLCRTGRIMCRSRWSSFDRQPSMLAFAEFSPNGLYGLRFSCLGVSNCVPEPGACPLLRLPQRAQVTPPKVAEL